MTFLNSVPRFQFLWRGLIALAFLGAILASPHRASAFGGAPQTRYVGVFQSIDYKNKTITFQPTPAGKTPSLGWSFETSFFADKKRVPADALKAGTEVKVKHRSPLFGRESASRVEWDSTPGQPAR